MKKCRNVLKDQAEIFILSFIVKLRHHRMVLENGSYAQIN